MLSETGLENLKYIIVTEEVIGDCFLKNPRENLDPEWADLE